MPHQIFQRNSQPAASARGAPPVTRVTGTGTLCAELSATFCADTVTGGFGMASGTSSSWSLELMLAFAD